MVGGPGCQALSRAQGSIGVPPVFSIRVQDNDQKLAGRTLPRSHEPICSRHSATQARRLCYHRLGVMPPLRPNSRGTSCQATIAPSLRDISQHAIAMGFICFLKKAAASHVYELWPDGGHSNWDLRTIFQRPYFWESESFSVPY